MDLVAPSTIVEILLADLRGLIADLGRNGGMMSGSVYDTAQVIRFCPPEEGTEGAVQWLLARQQPDGGWGSTASPRARDASTLAAILALRACAADASRGAVERGLAFLWKQVEHWRTLPDDLPIGVELTLPRLLDEALEEKLEVPLAQYEALRALGKKRLQRIAQMPPTASTPPAHSWDALRGDPDPRWQDASGGIGTSPSATAAWLSTASKRPELANQCKAARAYLRSAERATGTGIPGVVCTAHPYERTEQIWGLQAVWWAGLDTHPGLVPSVQRQADTLLAGLTPRGISHTDFFVPEGDDTSVAVSVLFATGRPVDTGIVKRYEQADHFVTFQGELLPSLSTTAHAVLALQLAGEDVAEWQTRLIQKQAPDGRWPMDKWHNSWLYPTSRVLLAIRTTADLEPVRKALAAIVRLQRPDGGWGTGDRSTMIETAYAILTLRSFRSRGLWDEAMRRSVAAGHRWMLEHYQPFALSPDAIWIGKESYCPYRVDRAYELSALLAVALDQAPASDSAT